MARALDLSYLDTGAMYRAVAVAFLDAGVDPSDVPGVIEATVGAQIDISLDPDLRWVRVNGRDVTTEIREPRVSQHVSAVSTVAECRANLVMRQRVLMDADPRGCVAEGRDVTTVIYPDADLRILLTADPAARLARRGGELGSRVDGAQLRDQVLRRDADDSRLVDFTNAADGVHTLDTTKLTLDEVVAAVVALAKEIA